MSGESGELLRPEQNIGSIEATNDYVSQGLRKTYTPYAEEIWRLLGNHDLVVLIGPYKSGKFTLLIPSILEEAESHCLSGGSINLLQPLDPDKTIEENLADIVSYQIKGITIQKLDLLVIDEALGTRTDPLTILRWLYDKGINHVLCVGNGISEWRFTKGILPWMDAARILNKQVTVYDFVPPSLSEELAKAFLLEKDEGASDEILEYVVKNFPRILLWLHNVFHTHDNEMKVTKDTVLEEWNSIHPPEGEGFLTNEQIRVTDKRLRFDILAWKIRHREELESIRAFRRRVYGEK